MEKSRKNSIAGLIEIGLTEKEALLYRAALKCGPATAQVLALESGIKRATTYSCIDSLIQKGLLHIEIAGVRKLFIAEAPERLATLLEQKKQILTKILPDLVQEYLHTSPSSNEVKVYHGVSGIKLVYDGILNTVQSGDDYFVISDEEKWLALDPAYFDGFRRKRALFGLRTQLILKESPHSRLSLEQQGGQLTEIKLLPQGIELSVNMIILKNKSVLVQIVEPYLAIQIENPNVASMNKALFGVLWNVLK